MSDVLRLEKTAAKATIWIDRQSLMNTIPVAMRNELRGLIRSLDEDEEVRVLIIRGAGDKAFSAGGDLSEFLAQAPAALEEWGDTLSCPER